MDYTKAAIILLSITIAGCSAHRPVSYGEIDAKSNWKVTHGSSLSRSTTVLSNGEFVIHLMPCNYEEKTTFIILPVPMPMGKSQGAKPEKWFSIVMGINYAPGPGKLRLGDIFLSLEGEKYQPVAMANNVSVCGNKQELLQPSQSIEITQKKQLDEYVYATNTILAFDLVTPPTNSVFTLHLGEIDFGTKKVKIPDVTFTKGAAWGGW